MLQNIRDRLTGPIVWVIIGIIAIPFAFWGIDTMRTGGGDPTVAKVGDQKITQSQFRAGYDQRLAQLQQLMGENFRQEMFDQNRFRQAVLEDMVQETLLRQHVRDAGYRASDAVLFDTLREIPAFQENGKFSTEAYRNRLAMQGYSPARFEAQLRDSLVIDQMREGILASAFVTDAAVAQTARVEEQQRALEYAVFDPAKYLPKVTVDPAQAQARYEEQKARYQAPERIKVAYVELALDKLPPADKPDAEVLRVIYEADKATRFSTAEERKARHLLVHFGADKDAARKKLEELAGRIKSGADFATLASEQSDDPGSKAKGGDLGWVKRGQMLEAFESALFALDKGEMSEPVETEFGWHLIKLEDLREARVRPFDDADVQAELLALYRKRDAERRYQEMSEKLEQTAFESPSSLEPVAKALGTEVQTSEWFTRGAGEGIAQAPAVREAAFSDEVLKNDENSRPLNLGENRVAVIRKASYEAPRQKAFEEVAAQVTEELRNQQARARAQAEAADALAKVEAGQALAAVAREKGVEFKAPGLVRRTAADVDRGVLEALFTLPRPENGQARWKSVALASGAVAVLGSSAVQDATWPPESVEDAQRQKGRLQQALSGAEFAAYRADLQKRIDVTYVEQPADAQAEQPENP